MKDIEIDKCEFTSVSSMWGSTFVDELNTYRGEGWKILETGSGGHKNSSNGTTFIVFNAVLYRKKKEEEE